MIFAIQRGASAQPLRQRPTPTDSKPVCYCANRHIRAFRNSFTFMLFQTPRALEKNSTLFFSISSALLGKTPGWGGQSRCEFIVRFRYTPKKPSVTPFPATDPKPPRCKSFQMNRSRKGGGGRVMPNRPKLATASAQQRASSVVVAQHAVPALRTQPPALASQSVPGANEVSLRSHLNLEGAKPQHGLLESFHLFSFPFLVPVPQHA
jgi:hypothetical protein